MEFSIHVLDDEGQIKLTGDGLTVHDHSTVLLGGQDLRAIEELELNDATTLTLDAAGAVTRTQAYHAVDTFGAAASDNLDTISGGVEGDLLIIRAANSARTVVVRHNQDNIWLSGAADLSLDDADDHLALIYDGTYWADIGWSAGGAAGGWPFTTVNVDATDADADYADLETAYAAGAAMYVVGEGQLHGTDAALNGLPADSTLVGLGQLDGLAELVEEATSGIALLLEGNSYVEGIRCDPDKSDSINAVGIYALASTAHIYDCTVEANQTGTSNAYALQANAGTTLHIYGGWFDAVSSVGDARGIYNGSGTVNVYLHNLPTFNFTAKADFFGTGGTLNVYGHFLDANGELWLCDGDITTNLRRGGWAAGTAETATIAGGVITADSVYIVVDTQGGAGSDELDTINAGYAQEGDAIIIRAANDARTVIVKHNTGNIWLIGEADISLEDTEDHLMLVYSADSMWCSVGDGGGAGGGAWPDTDKLTIGTAEYANLAAAIAAAGAGDLIKVGEGIFAVGFDTLPAGVDMIGSGIGISIFRTAGNATALTLAGSNMCNDFSVENNTDTGSTTYAISVTGADVELRHIRGAVNNPSGSGYGLFWNNVGGGKLVDCEGYSTGGGDNDGLLTFGGSADVVVEGGEFEGDDDDIDAGTGGDVLTLNDPLLVNGTIGATGTVQGWWVDISGDRISEGATLDVNGVADAVILDADGDTSISAPIDDQIDIEVGNADIIIITPTALRSVGSVFPNLGTTTLAEKLGHVYLGTAKDIYPYDDGGGLFVRNVNHWITPTDHFNAFSGYTWAAYAPFDGAPSTVDVATFPSLLRLLNDNITEDHYAYAATTTQILARLTKGLDSYIGIRLQDSGNDDNDFTELRLVDSPTTAGGYFAIQVRYQVGGGGVTTTTLTDPLPAGFYDFRLIKVGSNVYTYYTMDSPVPRNNGTVVGMTWTAARGGIIFGQRGGANPDRVGLVDWISLT